MTGFSEGNLPYSDAKKKFIRLDKIYNKYEKKLHNKKSPPVVNSLLYHNNIENYSLLSGIYSTDSKDIKSIAYHGNGNLNLKTMDILLKNADDLKGNRVVMIKQNKNILHPIYVYPLHSYNKNKILFASVSSSPFFLKEKFMFSGRFLKALFKIIKKRSPFIEVDYFDEISNEIDKIIHENINEEYYVKAVIYVFDSVEKIFNHLGIQTLIDVSGYIAETLSENYHESSRTMPLSIQEYVVLEKRKLSELHEDRKVNIDFVFNKIHIPYKSFEVKMKKIDSIHNLWEKLFHFSHFVRKDDIKKDEV